MTETNPGTLYGIGVGPGDPELITMKAIRILNQVDIVFAAASSKKSRSLALNVVQPHIPKNTQIEMLPFPMSKNQEEVQTAWKNNASRIIDVLRKGMNAVFLTLGDAMTYSTFSYVLKYMKMLAPDLSVVTIPGITSFQASAARLNEPLVEGDEALLVLSGVRGLRQYRLVCDCIENIVFLKAYRNIQEIVTSLEETGRFETSTGIRNCGLPEEELIRDLDILKESPPDYWTLIIAKQKNDHGQTT